ncbi:MAG: hypothetical protein AAFU56_06935, partial [Pseudomonadota bacterium]
SKSDQDDEPPMKVVSKPSSSSNQAEVPALEKDGKPITVDAAVVAGGLAAGAAASTLEATESLDNEGAAKEIAATSEVHDDDRGEADPRDEGPADNVIELTAAKPAQGAGSDIGKAPNVPEAQASGFVSIVESNDPDVSEEEPDIGEDPVSAAGKTTEAEASGGTEVKNRPSSPYKKADLDPDNDGLLDRRPDDPGIVEAEEEPKRGILF